jgi:hypothetical protein
MLFPKIVLEVIARRESLQIELETHQEKATFCRNSINHIDMTMIFCDKKPAVNTAKRRHNLHPKIFKHGMISLLVLDSLRKSAMPLTARQILDAILASPPDSFSKIIPQRVYNNVRSVLIQKIGQGIVRQNRSDGSVQTYEIIKRSGSTPKLLSASSGLTTGESPIR